MYSLEFPQNTSFEMHIDTDEANAAELNPGAEGLLIQADISGHLTKRKIKYDKLKGGVINIPH